MPGLVALEQAPRHRPAAVAMGACRVIEPRGFMFNEKTLCGGHLQAQALTGQRAGIRLASIFAAPKQTARRTTASRRCFCCCHLCELRQAIYPQIGWPPAD